jgi:5-methylcytosine-specific restriction protein A
VTARLKTLKPQLGELKRDRIKTLDTKAGNTPRLRGRALQKVRGEALLAGLYFCVDCGLTSLKLDVDHEIPLEQGGTYDPANLKVRCKPCHKLKSAREAAARAGR